MKTWRVVCLALALSGVSVLAQADPATISSATCPGAGCVVYSVSGQGSVGVQITGTFVGTAQFEQSNDGVTWFALTLYTNAGASATSTTGTGFWTGSVAGASFMRVRFSAWTSGGATVYETAARATATAASAASRILFGDGTASAPPIAFANNPTTGLLNVGGVPVISVLGTERFFVASLSSGVTSNTTFGWSSSSTDPTLLDTTLARSAAGVVKSSGDLQVTPVAVASLPTCNSTLKGTHGFVTDASATTFMSTVASGGANNVPVVCDGTNWKIG